ncbi:MAG: hypothetical protein JW844_08085, partial [Candidatus Omnitrophica bacterium]|nr:hypothetical protein [Candidatus Omnitrophota bacterium]
MFLERITRHISFKIISINLIYLFIWNQVAFAAPQSTPQTPLPRPTPKKTVVPISKNSIVIPESLATIRSFCRPSQPKAPTKTPSLFPDTNETGRFIFHIQDLHAHPDAQLTIAALIEYLHKTYGTSLVLVEGAEGAFDTAPFDFINDDILREEASRFFLERGKLTGSEYALVNSGMPITLLGIEEIGLYKTHLKTYLSQEESRERLFRDATRLIDALETQANRVLSFPLRQFFEKQKAYNDGRLSLNEYATYLNGASQDRDLDISALGNVRLLLQIAAIENKLDMTALDSEAQRLHSVLRRRASPDESEHISELRRGVSLKIISQREYLSVLLTVAERNGIPLIPPEAGPEPNEETPQSAPDVEAARSRSIFQNKRRAPATQQASYEGLARFSEYLALSRTLDEARLFDEFILFEEMLEEALCATDEEKDLALFLRAAQTIRKFSRLDLSCREFEFYQRHKASFSAGALSDGARRYIPDFLTQNPDLPHALAQDLAEVAHFYELALDRNRAMTQRVLAAMKKENATSAVLIAGGFHTGGICELLRQADTGYCVLAPQFTGEPDRALYEATLKGTEIPFEELLKPAFTTTAPGYLLAPLSLAASTRNDIDLRKYAIPVLIVSILLCGLIARQSGLEPGEIMQKIIAFFGGNADFAQAGDTVFTLVGEKIQVTPDGLVAVLSGHGAETAGTLAGTATPDLIETAEAITTAASPDALTTAASAADALGTADATTTIPETLLTPGISDPTALTPTPGVDMAHIPGVVDGATPDILPTPAAITPAAITPEVSSQVADAETSGVVDMLGTSGVDVTPGIEGPPSVIPAQAGIHAGQVADAGIPGVASGASDAAKEAVIQETPVAAGTPFVAASLMTGSVKKKPVTRERAESFAAGERQTMTGTAEGDHALVSHIKNNVAEARRKLPDLGKAIQDELDALTTIEDFFDFQEAWNSRVAPLLREKYQPDEVETFLSAANPILEQKFFDSFKAKLAHRDRFTGEEKQKINQALQYATRTHLYSALINLIAEAEKETAASSIALLLELGKRSPFPVRVVRNKSLGTIYPAAEFLSEPLKEEFASCNVSFTDMMYVRTESMDEEQKQHIRRIIQDAKANNAIVVFIDHSMRELSVTQEYVWKWAHDNSVRVWPQQLPVEGESLQEVLPGHSWLTAGSLILINPSPRLTTADAGPTLPNYLSLADDVHQLTRPEEAFPFFDTQGNLARSDVYFQKAIAAQGEAYYHASKKSVLTKIASISVLVLAVIAMGGVLTYLLNAPAQEFVHGALHTPKGFSLSAITPVFSMFGVVGQVKQGTPYDKEANPLITSEELNLLENITPDEIGIFFPVPRASEVTPSDVRELYDTYPTVKATYDCAVKLLNNEKYSLDRLLFAHLEEDKYSLSVMTIAAFLQSLTYRVFEEKSNGLFKPGLLSGNCVGLMVALVVSNSVSLEEMLTFIREFTEKIEQSKVNFGAIVIKGPRVSEAKIEPFLKPGEIELGSIMPPMDENSDSWGHITIYVRVGEGSTSEEVNANLERLKNRILAKVSDGASMKNFRVDCFYPLLIRGPHNSFHGEAFRKEISELVDSMHVEQPQINIASSSLPGQLIVTIEDVRRELKELLFLPISHTAVIREMEKRGVKLLMEFGVGSRTRKDNVSIGANLKTFSVNNVESFKLAFHAIRKQCFPNTKLSNQVADVKASGVIKPLLTRRNILITAAVVAGIALIAVLALIVFADVPWLKAIDFVKNAPITPGVSDPTALTPTPGVKGTLFFGGMLGSIGRQKAEPGKETVPTLSLKDKEILAKYEGLSRDHARVVTATADLVTQEMGLRKELGLLEHQMALLHDIGAPVFRTLDDIQAYNRLIKEFNIKELKGQCESSYAAFKAWLTEHHSELSTLHRNYLLHAFSPGERALEAAEEKGITLSPELRVFLRFHPMRDYKAFLKECEEKGQEGLGLSVSVADMKLLFNIFNICDTFASGNDALLHVPLRGRDRFEYIHETFPFIMGRYTEGELDDLRPITALASLLRKYVDEGRGAALNKVIAQARRNKIGITEEEKAPFLNQQPEILAFEKAVLYGSAPGASITFRAGQGEGVREEEFFGKLEGLSQKEPAPMIENVELLYGPGTTLRAGHVSKATVTVKVTLTEPVSEKEFLENCAVCVVSNLKGWDTVTPATEVVHSYNKAGIVLSSGKARIFEVAVVLDTRGAPNGTYEVTARATTGGRVWKHTNGPGENAKVLVDYGFRPKIAGTFNVVGTDAEKEDVLPDQITAPGSETLRSRITPFIIAFTLGIAGIVFFYFAAEFYQEAVRSFIKDTLPTMLLSMFGVVGQVRSSGSLSSAKINERMDIVRKYYDQKSGYAKVGDHAYLVTEGDKHVMKTEFGHFKATPLDDLEQTFAVLSVEGKTVFSLGSGQGPELATAVAYGASRAVGIEGNADLLSENMDIQRQLSSETGWQELAKKIELYQGNFLGKSVKLHNADMVFYTESGSFQERQVEEKLLDNTYGLKEGALVVVFRTSQERLTPLFNELEQVDISGLPQGVAVYRRPLKPAPSPLHHVTVKTRPSSFKGLHHRPLKAVAPTTRQLLDILKGATITFSKEGGGDQIKNPVEAFEFDDFYKYRGDITITMEGPFPEEILKQAALILHMLISDERFADGFEPGSETGIPGSETPTTLSGGELKKIIQGEIEKLRASLAERDSKQKVHTGMRQAPQRHKAMESVPVRKRYIKKERSPVTIRNIRIENNIPQFALAADDEGALQDFVWQMGFGTVDDFQKLVDESGKLREEIIKRRDPEAPDMDDTYIVLEFREDLETIGTYDFPTDGNNSTWGVQIRALYALKDINMRAAQLLFLVMQSHETRGHESGVHDKDILRSDDIEHTLRLLGMLKLPLEDYISSVSQIAEPDNVYLNRLKVELGARSWGERDRDVAHRRPITIVSVDEFEDEPLPPVYRQYDGMDTAEFLRYFSGYLPQNTALERGIKRGVEKLLEWYTPGELNREMPVATFVSLFNEFYRDAEDELGNDENIIEILFIIHCSEKLNFSSEEVSEPDHEPIPVIHMRILEGMCRDIELLLFFRSLDDPARRGFLGWVPNPFLNRLLSDIATDPALTDEQIFNRLYERWTVDPAADRKLKQFALSFSDRLDNLRSYFIEAVDEEGRPTGRIVLRPHLRGYGGVLCEARFRSVRYIPRVARSSDLIFADKAGVLHGVFLSGPLWFGMDYEDMERYLSQNRPSTLKMRKEDVIEGSGPAGTVLVDPEGREQARLALITFDPLLAALLSQTGYMIIPFAQIRTDLSKNPHNPRYGPTLRAIFRDSRALKSFTQGIVRSVTVGPAGKDAIEQHIDALLEDIDVSNLPASLDLSLVRGTLRTALLKIMRYKGDRRHAMFSWQQRVLLLDGISLSVTGNIQAGTSTEAFDQCFFDYGEPAQQSRLCLEFGTGLSAQRHLENEILLIEFLLSSHPQLPKGEETLNAIAKEISEIKLDEGPGRERCGGGGGGSFYAGLGFMVPVNLIHRLFAALGPHSRLVLMILGITMVAILAIVEMRKLARSDLAYKYQNANIKITNQNSNIEGQTPSLRAERGNLLQAAAEKDRVIKHP